MIEETKHTAEETLAGDAPPVRLADPSVAARPFPDELSLKIWDQVDRRIAKGYVITFLSVGAIILGLSFIKPVPEITEKEAVKMKARIARFELAQKAVEEKKAEAVEKKAEAKTAEQPATAARPAVDRAAETVEQREIRRTQGAEERAQARQQMAQEIEQSGIFAELTALGGGEGGGEVVDDLLEATQAANLGNGALKSTGFVSRSGGGILPAGEAGEAARRGERVVAQGIGASRIERAQLKEIKATAEVTLAQPGKVEGASKGESSRTGDAISRVVAKIQVTIKSQYEKYLRQDPSLQGRVDIEFTIGADGSVTDILVARSTLKHEALEQRLVRMLERLHFPPATADVRITYPFVFAASGT